MNYTQETRQQAIYQANPNLVQNIKSVRHQMHNVLRQHANQVVRIETVDGQVIIGRIIGVENGLLYLAIQSQGAARPFFGAPGYNETILTLVLYELLVITLLYT